MKKNVTIICLIVFYAISNVSAQSLKTAAIDLKLTKTKAVTPRLRNTGIGFLCFGIATITGGIAMVNAAHGVTYYSSTSYSGTQGSLTGAMGALGIFGGSISTIGGGLMTYFGQRKYNTAKRIQQNVSLNLTPFSGSITYHF